MKQTRYVLLTLLAALMSVVVKGQERNVLRVPDVTVQIGQVQLPVAIENTDEIVAAQFDLTLPTGLTAGTEAQTTNRCDGHTVIIRNMGATRYRVMLYSDANRPLLGQQGTVLNIPLTVPQNFVEGSEHQLTISNATLSVASGDNVLTEATAGKLTISKLPDLTVKNIVAVSQTVVPGEHLSISWQVENVGGLATGAGWCEQIMMVNKRRTYTKLIGTVYCQEPLEAGGVVSRQADLQVPVLLGIEGEAYLQVRIVTNKETGESTSAAGNNMLQAAEVFTVEKKLLVEPSPMRLVEGTTSRVNVKVSRSGDWGGEQTFSLSATNDPRISLPAQVTIPAGQSAASVYMNVANNTVLDNDSIVIVTATGNGYPESAARLVIEDNEYPDLQLTASKSVVTEGETFQLTVTTTRTSEQPIVVTLTSETAKRFSFPQTVTIPAGETSATVDVTAVEDETPSLNLSNAFTASAPKYNKAEAVVLLQDNDLPVLQLTLTPTTVSESAGVVAVAAVLRRTTNTNSKITVRLSDDADGGLYYGNKQMVLDKGVEEVHFNFGPVDNAIVDGDRTYIITAAVWISSCSCGASGESAGYVTAQLNVLDNDGPALSLTSSLNTVKEGGKTILTVSRNTTDNAAPLTVTLNSDYEEGLTYEHTVTIPAGQQSTTVEVSSAANSVQGDSHTVIFTIQAEGYAKGTCFMMVTDQTLPDARISSIAAETTEEEVGTRVKLTIEVTNDGAVELPAEVAVKVYHRGESNAVASLYTSEPVAIGGSQILTKTITLPTTVGSHCYYAVVNAENSVQELTYNNNTSQDVVIKAIAPFSVSVNTDKAIYQQGEKIIITGQLTGSGTANADVELYIINEGSRQMQTVKTDEVGAFAYEWQLYTLQSGHFAVGACYPGEGLEIEMATFDVYGLRRTSNDYITCETKLGEQYEGTIMIENPGVLSQTVTSFEVVSKPEACEVVLEAPTVIAANSRTQLKYKLTGGAVTEKKDWEIITAKLTTEEGSSLTLTLYYYCAAHHAVLTTNTTSIKTTMTKGATREYLLNVMNTGKAPTGKINVQIPNVEWMRLGTSTVMPSLEYGETATISLLLTPTDDMPLNLFYTGQIALNCENGNGVTVSYNFEVVSEATGILNVDVVDEYTYYTEENPHVAGASVVVRHPVTGVVVAQGLTGDNGIFSVELPEGYYSISVSEGHHKSMTGNILIDPGTTNYQEVFLSYTAITYSWDVVETEVEDEYKIETIAKFETNVPKPIVVINLPKERPADGSIIAILVTNKGLINAQNVVMNLDCTDGYELELLNPDPVEILAPQQMYTFYARFKKNPTATSRRRAWGNPDADCISIFAGALYDYMCGNAKNMEEALAQNGWGDCIGDGGGTTPSRRIVPVSHTPVPHTGPSWPGGPGRGYCSGCTVSPTSNGPGVLEQLRQWYCSLPCGKELTQALACEAANRIIPDWISCPYNIANNCLYGTAFDCIEQTLDCTPGSPDNPLDCWEDYIECMINHFRGNHNRSMQAEADVRNTGYLIAINYKNGSALLEKERKAFWMIVKEHLGSDEWLDCDNGDLARIFSIVNRLGENHVYTIEDFLENKPSIISIKQLERFVERVNNTFRNKDTGYEGINNYINLDTVSHYQAIINQCEEEAKSYGWKSVAEMYSFAFNDLKDYLSESTSSVCASVSIKLSQTMVMTRQAFRGTLTVFNGNEETSMQDVKLNLEVVNQNTGEVATSHEFQINAESLEGFIGELDLGSGWTLTANSTGMATVLFIPTKYAAPDEPVNYSFGGTLIYIDPFTGLEVTRELYPVTLTVKPSPELDLTYFMQRDVYGDDPLTLDVVEPMQPAEFALLINNKGNGDATNVRMVTQQPEIIDNEKGLHVDFEIVSSQVNGADAALAFGQSIANDFGTIPAHSQTYAQWWLTSTLLGHFTDYKVEATHVTSYGNEDLMLLDQVTIHELIHSLEVSSDGNKLRGFMVNDITDAEDLPDMLYLTNGEVKPVAIATSANGEKISAMEYRLTVVPSSDGWNYGSFMDPAHSLSTIKSVVRQSDGKEIPLQNFWQTDRTLRDGKDWLYENRIHFADEFATQSPETYILTFEPTPAILLDVASIEGIPEEGNIAVAPVENIKVNFTKKVNPETFTAEDLTFAVQGVKQDASGIGIFSEDNKAFTLDMSACSELSNGYYTLTVQTADITDEEGFQGKSGKQVGWILFRGGLVQLLLKAYPENSGTVMRKPVESADVRRHAPAAGGDNSAEYGSTVVLFAEPKEGYEFSNWTLNGIVVSNELEYTTTALGDMDVVANFTKKRYRVEIGVDGDGGTTQGTATGIYEYGTEINVSAKPDEDYMFKGWTVDGEQVEDSAATITALVKKPLDIKASFMQEYYRHSMTFARGWNWMSSYLDEPLALDVMANYVHRIVGQFDEIISDPEYGLVGNMTEMAAGKAYKVEANARFTDSFRGHLYDMDAKPISLHQGWNWIGYPYKESSAINSAIQNAEEGDYLVSQTGFAEYADGVWEGTLDALEPGAGYLYKSLSEKILAMNLAPVSGSRSWKTTLSAHDAQLVDYHRYPNTMNITAKIYHDGIEQSGPAYNVYAMANGEIRGVGQPLGSNYYLTVYGEDPVEVTFVIESTETGCTFIADQALVFRDDVIGSRKQPYAIGFGSLTGINQKEAAAQSMTIYSMEGILISRDATIKTLRKLPKGIYIVNGQKCYVK